MTDVEKLAYERQLLSRNQSINFLYKKLGLPEGPPDTVSLMDDLSPSDYVKNPLDGIQRMATELDYQGGFPQQHRMIYDKYRSFQKALLHSYQAAIIKKVSAEPTPPIRALINPNKLKMDYDEKVVSVGFEHGYKVGDVFQWLSSSTYWLIYLQELSELAYFRGAIRRCNYQIKWEDEDGNLHQSYVVVRGPVETKIDSYEKHGRVLDMPNYSINILMPSNDETIKAFRRYSKFYLSGENVIDNSICWRVEAVDSFSSPGILQLNAVEYYANEQEDADGIVGTLIEVPADPNPDASTSIYSISGETFIKPKLEYTYKINKVVKGAWSTDREVPVKLTPYTNDTENGVVLYWKSTYSGEFDLLFGPYKKHIIVKSLF